MRTNSRHGRNLRVHSEVLSSGDPDLELRVVTNGRLRLAFLPAVGGRLLSLEVGGRELLWRNPAFFDASLRAVVPRGRWPTIDGSLASWSNVGGSKSWPAPQGWDGPGQWPGPPDATLDAGEWSWDEHWNGGTLEIEMTSPDDERTGLRITRRFTIAPDDLRLRQRVEFTSIGSAAVRWAPWEVCQVNTSQGVGVASSGIRVTTAGGTPLHQGDWWRRIRAIVGPDSVMIPVQDAVGKRGFADATGRVEWIAPDGAGLALCFEPDAHAEYPDGGARAEVWMQAPTPSPLEGLSGLHPDAYLAELEVLGPLATLGPGEQAGLDIVWEVHAPSHATALVHESH